MWLEARGYSRGPTETQDGRCISKELSPMREAGNHGRTDEERLLRVWLQTRGGREVSGEEER